MEELLNFLTNDIIKSQFFAKDNLIAISKADFEIKIKNKILEDITEQYKLKKNLSALG